MSASLPRLLDDEAFIASSDEAADLYIPPLNFALVSKGVYRSGYPNAHNTAFLEKLGLRTIVYLCPETYLPYNQEFVRENNIELIHVGSFGNKEPFQVIPLDLVKDVLRKILDVRYHPMLVHCNKGIHRTGCVVGCLRKLQRWSLTSIFAEYGRFAGARRRLLDQQFIELFDTTEIEYVRAHAPQWL